MGARLPPAVSDYLRRQAEARLAAHLTAAYPSIEWGTELWQPPTMGAQWSQAAPRPFGAMES